MNEFLDILRERFDEDEPIMTEELIEAFSGVSRVTVFNWLSKAMEDGFVRKFRRGIYYLPRQSTVPGVGELPLSSEKVIEKKYLRAKDIVYGYISGLNLENEVHVSPQMPATLEITTNKASKRIQEIEPFGGYRKIALRKPRVEVTKDNVNALRFLDLITYAPLGFFNSLENYNMTRFSKTVDRSTVINCLPYYPAKTAKRLLESEYFDVLA